MTDHNNSIYKNKIIKYKNKCEKLENILSETNLNLQKGGKSDDQETRYIEQFKKIKKDMKSKGKVFWFDENSKLLVKSNSESLAREEILKKITKNIEKWENKTLCCITIEFDSDNVLDKKSGGIDLSVELNIVSTYENDKGKIKILLSQKDRQNSLLRLFYKYDELEFFNISDFKKIVNVMIEKKIKKLGALKFYHYSDVSKYF